MKEKKITVIENIKIFFMIRKNHVRKSKFTTQSANFSIISFKIVIYAITQQEISCTQFANISVSCNLQIGA